ncbi:hypothetical protein [Dryocola sp. BD586]|jgi:hypothetical protein|uniref:hypothetical protein n=1 Tax=Dryocola sp. BD586 TaxID=3133271 RepID=UPI003F506A2D
MNDQPGNVVTQAFAWLATLAAGLGITTQDMVYMIFGLAGVGISVASYINGRLDAHRKQKEDEKRTQLLQDYLAGLQNKNGNERLATARAVSEAIRRAGD